MTKGGDRHYVKGAFYRIDDRSGFKVRSYDTDKEWNGLWIRTDMWEPRQPQDFVRGTRDEQAAPEPRPRQIDAFLGPLQTTLTVAAAAGSVALSVASSVRMFAEDVVEVLVGVVDGSVQFRTTLADVPNDTSVVLTDPLPQAAVSGALFTNITASATVTPASLNAIP